MRIFHVAPISGEHTFRSFAGQLTNLTTDQAIRSLCDTWRPEVIPPAFAQSLSPPLDSSPPPPEPRSHSQDTPHQLLSPVSPSTQSTTLSFPPDTSGNSQIPEPLTDTAPIKGFVHEVLRRSKTSVGVLQTALCYLEAVRTRLPEVLRKDHELAASGYFGAEEDIYLDRITVENVTEGSACDDYAEASVDAASTLRVSDDADSVLNRLSSFGPMAAVAPTECATSETKRDAVLPPLPPQPSPLLCPRRTFLACLILASKFMQDRSYSNRAWAKLAGLPPREIGRCERAVGNVLEWRLWVGKDPNAGARHGRSLLRSRSDGDVLNPSIPSVQHHAPYPTPPPTPYGPDIASPAEFRLSKMSRVESSRSRCLRRCATAPSVGVEPTTPHGAAYAQVFSSGFVEEPASFEVSDLRTPVPDTRFLGPSAGQAPSPQWSTPPLSYSPMSTSSTSSDGSDDRTVQLAPLLEFPESSTLGFSAGGPDAWRDSSDVDMAGAPFSKHNMFNPPGLPAVAVPFSGAIVDASIPPLSSSDLGPIRLPSFSVGFPFYG